ncbi:MAG: baseplate assembly protein [Planctomycetes bacterium]|nr:baseplate assembly protein [Planctomycetota bacterium]
MGKELYGKYRGKVVLNIDPMEQGRLVALVPAVSDQPLTWALPCSPYVGDGLGFLMLPPIGANVWIEFEGGDADHPIWSGGFWAQGEAPAKPMIPTTRVLRTEKATLTFDDLHAAVRFEIETPSGTWQVVADTEGIAVTMGKSSVRIAPAGIKLVHAASSFELTPDGIAEKDGSS